MPRRYGTSKDVFQFNLRELIKSGRPQKQALAIAYKWLRKDRARKK